MAGLGVPDRAWTLGPYLHYWLENFVKRNRRPATYALYEMTVRLYLVPGLGNKKLNGLSVATIQDFLNRRLPEGDSVRKVQIMRTVLSAALTRALRDEMIIRNPARLAELLEWKRAPIRPRDAQTILGHTRISTTLEIYTDTDEQARRQALTRLQGLFQN